MIQRILSALFIGCILTVALAQRDPFVRAKIESALIDGIESAGYCTVQGHVTSLNLFSPTVELSDVRVVPKTGSDWQWGAQKIRAQFSWLHLLLYGSINLSLDIYQYQAHTFVESDAHILLVDHLNTLANAPAVFFPLFLRRLTLHHSSVELRTQLADKKVQLTFDSRTDVVGSKVETHVNLHHGCICYGAQDHCLISDIAGNITMQAAAAPMNQHNPLTARADLTWRVPDLPAGSNLFSAYGSWSLHKGRLNIKNEDQSVLIDPVSITVRDDGCVISSVASAPLDYYMRLCNLTSSTVPVTGKTFSKTTVTVGNGTIQEVEGSVALSAMTWSGAPIDSNALLVFSRTRDGDWSIQSTLNHGLHNKLRARGSFKELDRTGSCRIANVTDIELPYIDDILIKKNSFVVDATLDKNGLISSTYECLLSRLLKKTPQKFSQRDDQFHLQGSGSFTLPWYDHRVQKNASSAKASIAPWHIEGSFDDFVYTAHGTLTPSLMLEQWTVCSTKTQEPVIELACPAHDNKRIIGTVRMPFMRACIQKAFGYTVQGEGDWALRIFVDDNGFLANIDLVKGMIRLPGTYNFIKRCGAIIGVNLLTRTVTNYGLGITMGHGTCTSDYAVVQWDDKGAVSWCFVPLVVRHCLLNFNKDFFALLSGKFFVTRKKDCNPFIKGDLIIEKGQLKENILSSSFQKELMRYARSAHVPSDTASTVGCALSIKTKDPIRVKTKFLEAGVKADLMIKNSIHDPLFSGTLSLGSGTLFFPYKPLFISKGSVNFSTGCNDDPLIELVARN
jgi:hypothetical protein